MVNPVTDGAVFLACNVFPDYRTNVSVTEVIRDNYIFLLETLETKYNPYLVGILFSRGVLTDRDKDEITSEVGQYRQNEKLLSVLSRKSQEQFFVHFIEALDESNQRHVAEKLRGLPF